MGDGCKVDVVVDAYALDDAVAQYATVDERLIARWIGADGASADGYRTLTEWFNKQLLRRVYDERGRATIGNRVESDYEALAGDDERLKREVMDDLDADGIDAERLVGDMVSWSTIRSHLKDCLGSEKHEETPDSEWERESVAIARNVAEEKTSRRSVRWSPRATSRPPPTSMSTPRYCCRVGSARRGCRSPPHWSEGSSVGTTRRIRPTDFSPYRCEPLNTHP